MITKSGVKLVDFGLAKLRLRDRQASCSSCSVLPTHAGAEPDRRGHDPRDVPVHGARAARGPRSRRPHATSSLWRGPLRDGDGPEGVRGKEPGVAHRRDHPHEPRAISLVQPLTPPALDRVVQGLPREGPGRPVPDRARRQAPASMDRGGRLSGWTAGPRRRETQEPGEGRVGTRSHRGARRRGGDCLRHPAPKRAAAHGSVLAASIREDRASRSTRARWRSRPTAAAWPSSRPPPGPTCSGSGRSPACRLNPLAGTDGALYPFWSPDSRFVGFFANGKLKKIGGLGRTAPDSR